AEGARAFYRLYAARHGKPRWGDKTPNYVFHLSAIESLLPEARFIHIIRDGRDVALSLRPLWFSPGDDPATLAQQWRSFVSSARLQGAGCRSYLEIRYEALVLDPETSLRRLADFVDLSDSDRMLEFFRGAAVRLLEHGARTRANGGVVVTHEQRAVQQERTTRPLDSSRVFRWKHEMTNTEQSRFEEVGGDLLRDLGYEVSTRE
ncbi:MAG: sulfotransferase, partial [Thermoanaerobaculia bacterium]